MEYYDCKNILDRTSQIVPSNIAHSLGDEWVLTIRPSFYILEDRSDGDRFFIVHESELAGFRGSIDGPYFKKDAIACLKRQAAWARHNWPLNSLTCPVCRGKVKKVYDHSTGYFYECVDSYDLDCRATIELSLL